MPPPCPCPYPWPLHQCQFLPLPRLWHPMKPQNCGSGSASSRSALLLFWSGPRSGVGSPRFVVFKMANCHASRRASMARTGWSSVPGEWVIRGLVGPSSSSSSKAKNQKQKQQQQQFCVCNGFEFVLRVSHNVANSDSLPQTLWPPPSCPWTHLGRNKHFTPFPPSSELLAPFCPFM